MKAKEIIDLIKQGLTIDEIKSRICNDDNEWYCYSSKAYSIQLENAKRERKKQESSPHVVTNSNKDIPTILDINEKLADKAFLLPIFLTGGELDIIKSHKSDFPNSESKIIQIISKMTMQPRLRVLQRKGRFENLEYFKIFKKLIDAATLSYYRTNFISCYLTLVPVIEGIIIRWNGYSISDEKPEFEEIRKFFKNPALRQPCPNNIQFHDVYAKACDKILNRHFYKPTMTGNSFANFNRHVASHLLIDDEFATKENCIRLFMLLDAMTEIYLYESRVSDPRIDLKDEDILEEIDLLTKVILENTEKTPEQMILKTNITDLI